jgi:hypothetical protein
MAAAQPTPTAHVTAATLCTQGCTHPVNCYHPTLACPQHSQFPVCTQVACGGPGAGPQAMAEAVQQSVFATCSLYPNCATWRATNCLPQPAPAADATAGTFFTMRLGTIECCPTHINCYQQPAAAGPPQTAGTWSAHWTGACCHPQAPAADATVGTVFTPLCTRINCYQDATLGTGFTPLCTRINCYPGYGQGRAGVFTPYGG